MEPIPSDRGKARKRFLILLLGTLGGLSLFGAVGVIIGPVVAALFITIWEIYGAAFKDVLTEPIEAVPAPAGVLASSGRAQEEGHDIGQSQ